MSQNIQLYDYIFTENDFYPDIRDNPTLFEELYNKRFENLYKISFDEKSAGISTSANFLYIVSSAFFDVLTHQQELEFARENIIFNIDDELVQRLVAEAPFCIGSEYICYDWLIKIFGSLRDIFSEEIKKYSGTVAMYLSEKAQRLCIPERIFFHLVEQSDEDFPFAFLATYATEETPGKIRHMPLRYALTEFKDDHDKLIKMLSCLEKASDVSSIISQFMESGEMMHPLKLTADEALQLLRDVEAIEQNGILCRIPNWWRKKSASVSVSMKIDDSKTKLFGLDSIIKLKPELSIDGEFITYDEVQALLSQSEGLALVKGKWVEVNHEKLKNLLRQIENSPDGIHLLDAMRTQLTDGEKSDGVSDIKCHQWVSGFLNTITDSKAPKTYSLPTSFKGQLRPYQDKGYSWLNTMRGLGLGACLADDMGLGKTIQILAFLENLRKEKHNSRTLLIVPASLLGNWESEIKKFVPQMDYTVLHGKTAAELSDNFDNCTSFLVITTYAMSKRIEALKEKNWDCLILDEAQAIKNPSAKQTKEIKNIKARIKIAMTGTPIENDLSNLWSLFDFLNKGLLGTAAEFKKICKKITEDNMGYYKLKSVIMPFMLRRVKTDKSIINDLPDKIENIEYASLSKKQVVLYRKLVNDMENTLNSNRIDGIAKKGIVLSAIGKLKQICNHPDQYLGQSSYDIEESGKLKLMAEICETIYEKREKLIVFTQFKEITQYLSDFLSGIFKREGFVLHGGTPVKSRQNMVEKFQSDEYIPYMVISLKAGGTGLNLTKATHVIHFDRWWNPAVENQATDRAFRIGQNKNVIVHKFVCRGTIEEKIDEIINSKTKLSQDIIGSSGEKWITELSNKELLEIMKLTV